MEQVVRVDQVDLCYETFGSRDHPALLLVTGFTAQMTAWDVEFCRALAERDLFVVRFDNRDAGRSSKSSGRPPALAALFEAVQGDADDGPTIPYTLSAMAADAVGLLDALGIDRAHVVGASMGGMIVQHLAFEHPGRVLTATSIMSTTGDPAVGQADDSVLAALLRPPPAGRDDYIEQAVQTSRLISGSMWREEDARARAAAAYDRMHHPVGAAFQLAAIVSSGDRTPRLGSITAPFLVIHGREDPLIDVSGGRATAAAIDGAELRLFDGMGHDLPRPLWPVVIDAIHRNTTRSA